MPPKSKRRRRIQVIPRRKKVRRTRRSQRLKHRQLYLYRRKFVA